VRLCKSLDETNLIASTDCIVQKGANVMPCRSAESVVPFTRFVYGGGCSCFTSYNNVR
jgi:hypothetical protein